MKQKSVSFPLHLNNYCIETAARKRLRALESSALEGHDVSNDEFEFLKRFLSLSDFKGIRSDRPDLNGCKNLWAVITEKGDSFEIHIQTEID